MLSQQQIDQLLAEWAASPPPGQVRDTINPTSLKHYDVGLLVVLLTLSTLAVLMRLYTRWFLTREYLLEDFIILLAWCCQWAQDFLGFRVMYYIYDRHAWDLTNAALFEGQYWVNWTAISYGPTIVVIKVAIILQYLHIFVPSRTGSPFMFMACWSWLILLIVFYIITTILTIFQCRPRAKIWQPWIEGHCFSNIGLFMGNGIMNVISDVVILCLPILSLYRLRMPLRKKIGIGLLFATGTLACISSLLRTYWSWLILISPDKSWHVNVMGSLGWLEIALGIICYCLPIAPKFFRLTKQKIYDSSIRTALRARSVRANSAQTDETSVVPVAPTYKDNHPMVSGLSTYDRFELPSPVLSLTRVEKCESTIDPMSSMSSGDSLPDTAHHAMT